MQQVAAHKTDIAALPFSASSTAKAVETGIGTKQEVNGGNNQAFSRLYQEAKSSKSDFVLNDKEALGPHSSEAKRTGSVPANTSASNDAMKNGKDRDAGHTDLPTRDEVTDIPVGPSANQDESKTIGTRQAGQDSATTTPSSRDSEVNNNRIIEGVEGTVEQKSVIEAGFIIGEGGRKDAEAGVITSPGTPDGTPSKDDAEPDWVAYVETVANRFRKDDESLGDSDTRQYGEASEIWGEAANVVSVQERGKLWTLPEDVNASDEPSVMARMLSHLNSSGSGSGELTIESLSSEAQQTLSALTSLLLGANANDPQSGRNSEANGTPVHALEKLNVTDSDKQSADESLVLSLLADKLNDVQTSSFDDTLVQAQELLTELTSETGDAGLGAINAATSKDAKLVSFDGLSQVESSLGQTMVNDSLSGTDISNDLLSAISELSPNSAQKATEAFAERVVSAMPSGSQQQAVKTNIIAGINEFQQQVQQGREPGIDLTSIVADAAKEAAVSTEAIASMTTRLDSQATQFLSLMTQTQSSAQQTFASMMGQTDTVIQENTQVRAEASKSQQQFEGFDKAVNIHKPEGQQQLNEKIRWMVNARNTMAEIRLDPPELGSMQVRVNVAGDAASVSFVVQSQQAKDALADAMPRLRDMLSEQGIELGDAQVRKDNSSGNESGQQLAHGGSGETGASNRGENDGLDGMDETRIIEQSVTREAKGGIDFYA